MTLPDSLRTYVLTDLPYDRDNPKVVAALTAMSYIELLVIYLNWQNRFVSPMPRQVLRSPVFDENPMVLQRSTAITKIVKDIKQGRNLTKYLSRRVKVGFALPPDPNKKQLNRRKDLDLLLNDWGIYHMHISTFVEPDGFVTRDSFVIFAIFKAKHAYLIDVMNHGDWTNENLIRVIVSTWPNAGLVFELKGVLGTQHSYTAEERAKLRGVGLSAFVKIDNRVFAPGSMISSAGTSSHTFMTAANILRTINRFENDVKANPATIIDFIHQHGGKVAGEPAYEFSFFSQGFGVIETTSGFPIPLSR